MNVQKGFSLVLIIIAVFLLLAAGLVGFLISSNFNTKIAQVNPKQKACTQEAKLCPDGSAVGRTGMDCEFAVCPGSTLDETAKWKTYTATACEGCKSFSFKYPSIYQIREDYRPSGLGRVLVDNSGSYIDHYDLNKNKEKIPVGADKNKKEVFSIDSLEVYEYYSVSSRDGITDNGFIDNIMLVNFPERGNTIVIYLEAKQVEQKKLEEFRKIVRTIQVL